MKKQEIIEAIEGIVASYSAWTIGVTDDPERRKTEHDSPKQWYHWRADTETIARDVEKHFLDKGMKGGTGGGENLNYVYIFL